MKNLLTLFAILFFTSSVFSQINKGQWLMGGLAEMSYTRTVLPYTSGTTVDLDFAYQLSPDIGYFIIDGLAIGIRANSLIDHKVQPGYRGNYTYDYSMFSGAAFVRYYFLPGTSKVNMFLDGGYGYGYSLFNYTSTGSMSYYGNPPNYSTSNKAQDFFVSVGPVIFLTPGTGLEFLLSYNYSKNIDNNVYQHGFYLGVGFQIHIGTGRAEDVLRNKPTRPMYD